MNKLSTAARLTCNFGVVLALLVGAVGTEQFNGLESARCSRAIHGVTVFSSIAQTVTGATVAGTSWRGPVRHFAMHVHTRRT